MIAAVADTFDERPPPGDGHHPGGPPAPDGPLGWPGYGAARAEAARRTGETESVVHGTASLDGRPCVLLAFEFGFLGGSLGRHTGDRLTAAYTLARELRLPLVSLVATGGSRMQEGMVALTQLQRVARAAAELRAAGLAHLAVVRDPTTGGGWATVGAGADVVLALPGAQVGFAGSRVRPADADPYAYTAEGQSAAGQVDAVVEEEGLASTLGRWLGVLKGGAEAGAPASGVLPAPVPQALSTTRLPATGREAVARARAPRRPRAQAYLDAYFTHRLPLNGDRSGGTDPGTLCGFGLHGEQPVAYVAQCGTATRPAGYRTAARVLRLADRLGIPVLTLIDTPGAANDAAAERAGAGAAIADAFAAVAGARVPVTTLVIGEGGSGGALALASPGRTYVTADSYFSVIAPESAAAILKRPPAEADETADRLGLRPQDLVALGIARGIVGEEPDGP
ncbi:acetyl-CoA carboxylase [Streptomyces sp. NBC_01218]|uniref:carboxyl transferase domain-containing protein n=1 Tax=Streptomyces sp. NBC_01218 TaxID=2903780 RepID=UPI002E13912C|nr:acetyl-CoA carboxylase [Streptomyces sp. NBC_01218]